MSDVVIKSLWTILDNNDYDDIWDVIFAEEGIVPEDDEGPLWEEEDDDFDFLDEDSELIYDTQTRT